MSIETNQHTPFTLSSRKNRESRSGSLTGILLIALLVLISCNSDVLFDDTKRIPGDVWNQYEKVLFEVPVMDTVNRYKFYLNIRHNSDYRYSNIHLFISTLFPDGRKARDTVECILARPDGKWLGKGITGIKDNQVLLRTGLIFPEAGMYSFELEQAMRQENLEGITDIGLRIEKE